MCATKTSPASTGKRRLQPRCSCCMIRLLTRFSRNRLSCSPANIRVLKFLPDLKTTDLLRQHSVGIRLILKLGHPLGPAALQESPIVMRKVPELRMECRGFFGHFWRITLQRAPFGERQPLSLQSLHVSCASHISSHNKEGLCKILTMHEHIKLFRALTESL